MINENFHTHTYRCGHAKGSDRDYVINAIKAGIKVLGFSDHCPYPFKEEGIRMEENELDGYKESVLSLKEEFKGQIDIHLGLEVECFKDQWDLLKKYRMEMDYLILGQHDLSPLGQSSYHLTTPEELKKYTDLIEYAASHSLMEYIAHPDVCLWGYPRIDDAVLHTASRLAEISKRYEIPLEVNCGSGVKDYGYRRYEEGMRYAYPTRAFFEVFAKEQCPLIYGIDIHDPALFLTDLYVDRVNDILKGLDLNVIEHFDILKEAEKHKRIFY